LQKIISVYLQIIVVNVAVVISTVAVTKNVLVVDKPCGVKKILVMFSNMGTKLVSWVDIVKVNNTKCCMDML
jgi:hypothetical protein